MGTIKDGIDNDLIKAEEIKKRQIEYTEELYKKDLSDLDNHDGMVQSLIQSQTSWSVKSSGPQEALLPIKLMQMMKFQQSYLKFKKKKNDAIKVLHSKCQQIWKTQQWLQDWKRSFFTPIPKNGSTKECSVHQTIALISHAINIMLKIIQVSFHHYVN